MSELGTPAPLTFDAPKSGRLGQVSWALFEWARNPYYILIVIYIFGPYFSHEVIGDPVRGQEIVGLHQRFRRRDHRDASRHSSARSRTRWAAANHGSRIRRS